MDCVFTILAEKYLLSVCQNLPFSSNRQTAINATGGTPQQCEFSLQFKVVFLSLELISGVQDPAWLQPKDFQQSGGFADWNLL